MSESFTSYLRDLFSGLGPVTLRKMFGGQGVYHNGIIIGLVIGEELFLKTDADTRGDFGTAGGAPFTYEGKGKPVVMSYWTPPVEAMESPQAMQPWARLAYAAAMRGQAAKRLPKKTVKPAVARKTADTPAKTRPARNARAPLKPTAGKRKSSGPESGKPKSRTTNSSRPNASPPESSKPKPRGPGGKPR